MIRRSVLALTLALAAGSLLPAVAHAAPATPDTRVYARTSLIHYYSGPDLQTEVGESFYNKCNSWEWGQQTQWSTTEVTWLWCEFYG